MPKVSVIIATHSRPHLLPRAIESAFAAGKEVQVVVVDDASTDETAEVCRNIKNIKYVRIERNQRTAGARNVGIAVADADYIAFLDDDDLRLPGSLDKQIEILDKNPEVGLVYGKIFLGDDDCVPTETIAYPEICPQGDVFWELLKGNFIPCLTAVFRKECLFSVGLLEKHLYGVDDYDLWIRISELYPIMALEEPVAIWRQSFEGSGQGSSDRAKEVWRCKMIAEKNLKLPRAATDSEKRAEVIASLKNSTSDRLIWAADDSIKYGASKVGRSSIIKAVRLNPSRALRPKTLKLLFRSFLNAKVLK